MKFKLDRMISIATLVALLVVIFLMLKKPAPVAQPAQTPRAVNAPSFSGQSSDSQSSTSQSSTSQSSTSQSSNQKADQADQAAKQAQQTQPSQAGGGYSAGPTATLQPGQNLSTPHSPKAEAHIDSDQISAAVSQLLGASGAGLTPDSNVGDGVPNIKDQKVTYDGDTVHGQFLTEIGGKDVWITISGHMGQKDGYATFDPTEFKVGDVEVPVSLVNPALQRKLAEERDRLKIAEPAR